MKLQSFGSFLNEPFRASWPAKLYKRTVNWYLIKKKQQNKKQPLRKRCIFHFSKWLIDKLTMEISA